VRERHSARVRNELIAAITHVLATSETMRQQAGSDMVLRDLVTELGPGTTVDSRRSDPLTLWIRQVVKTCATTDEGLQTLARCFSYAEQGSKTALELWRLADEWEALSLFEGADLHPLRPVLHSIRSPSLLTRLARKASHARTQELEAWCGTGWEVFLHLAGDNAAADELPPAMAFLALASDHLVKDGRAEEAEELRRWNRRQAQERGLADELAGWQQDAHVPPSEPSLHPAYLLIQLEPDGVDLDSYYLSHWRQSDSDGWHPIPGETLKLERSELPGAVDRLIEEAEERWADLSQPVIIEYILPWQLLNEPVEWWCKETDTPIPTPLVMDYTVVLRSFDRLRKGAWHRPWNNRWRQLKERPADSRAHWGTPEESAFHLERRLKEDEQIVCLILSESPQTDSPTANQEFVAALRAGIPALLWDRGGSGVPFREAAADIVGDGGLAGLLERTRRWRSAALALGPEGWHDHVGRHMALLLDDPERLPGPAAPAGRQGGS
jgi:muconolactone delta-isomerase